MGYVRKPQIFKITWDDDSELAGLEIRARRVSTGQFLHIHELAKSVQNDRDDDGDLDEMLDGYRTLCEEFSKVLASWNLEVPENEDDEDGPARPVPATLDGLLDQDLPFVLTVVFKWIAVMIGVTPELGKDSPSGETSPEASLPMEPLSPNLESLSAPV